jgi:hypothetical protein
MKKTLGIVLGIVLLCGLLPAEDYKLTKTEDIQKTLSFPEPGRAKGLQVDNIFGAIRLEGYGGRDVQLKVRKTIKARNQAALDRALQEVDLDITTDNNTIDLYVDGPFRDQDEEGRRGRRNPGYQVHYDFEIKVPVKTDILLKTVTEGDIEVSNIEGEFEVRNVNGKVTIEEIAGAGTAHTVNGAVRVTFSRNPGAECSFKTINGDLDVYFASGLSADFSLKTFNGDILSDFPVTYLPQKPGKAERKGGKYVYRSNRFVGVRTGNGGPEMKMDTLNGDILIHKR